LEKLLFDPDPGLSAMQSALYAGDRLMAVEVGLRSRTFLHEWFSAYNRDYANFSPGHILFVELAKQARELGIRRMDAGKRETMEYKGSFMSASHLVAEGSVAIHPLLRMARSAWPRFRDGIKSSPLRLAASWAGEWTRSLRGRLSFR
jgi:CelD/BcsL family acetyltransferase involved in cellulose biosynthesis